MNRSEWLGWTASWAARTSAVAPVRIGERRHLDELGARIADHLSTEQALLGGVEHQLQIPVVLAGGSAIEAPRRSCVATWHFTPRAVAAR